MIDYKLNFRLMPLSGYKNEADGHMAKFHIERTKGEFIPYDDESDDGEWIEIFSLRFELLDEWRNIPENKFLDENYQREFNSNSDARNYANTINFFHAILINQLT